MNVKTKTYIAALNSAYGPSASNFVLTVVARQVAFLLESKGMTPTTAKSDTASAPKATDDQPVFDASLAIDTNEISALLFGEEKPFSLEHAVDAYACCMLLAVEAINTPLEYGRKPDPKSIGRYFSTPQDWLGRKMEYWTPRLSKEARDQGSAFSASADSIEKNAAAKIAEMQGNLTARAKNLAAMIRVAQKQYQSEERETLLSTLDEMLDHLNIHADEEVKAAGIAMMRIRKAAYEAGEKTTTPQPGVLALFSVLGVKIQ